jgi:LysM repeat protein
MALEDMNMEPEEPEEESPATEDTGNRTFIIVAGAIGAVLILSIVCLALYALVIRPRQANQRATEVAAINAQNTQIAVAAEQTALAGKATFTPTPIPAGFQGVIEYTIQQGDTLESIAKRFMSTVDAIRKENEGSLEDPNTIVVGRVIRVPVNVLLLPPTNTPVLASPTVSPPSPTIDRTATVAALLTEAAAGKLTATPTTSALPTTGFVEDVGVPGLLGIALVMILLIFLARRLRTANS